MKHRFLMLSLITFCQIASADEPHGYWTRSTWQDPDRGFLWYAAPRADTPEQAAPRPLEAMTNKELRMEIDRLLDAAVERQTPEAVRAYLHVQQVAMDRASTFSDVFRRTVWTTPELDYSLRGRPTNALAVAAFDARRAQVRNETSESIAGTHGLFFFFRASCAYCHQLAPVLKLYQRTYGIEVFPVSLDGSSLPDFPNASSDNGIARKLSINAVPALFLADKRSGAIQPVGYGLLSLEDLVNRVHVLTRTQPGEEY